ncbi:hypothetical protein SESBI_48164, partial [Sesbania bispinosa]
ATMDVFFSYENQGVNPVPAIVADTLLSLEICHQKKGGTLRCCNHLLFVWLITHLYAPGHMDGNSDPFRSFHRIPIKDQTSYEWKRDFMMFKADHFPWFVPRKEELGGLIFQYNASEANGQLEEVRVAWGNVIKKGERELGSPHAIATPEYKEWRANRILVVPSPEETLQKEKSTQTNYHVLASVTSQLEVVKAHLRLVEEKEERAQIEIEILIKQCQNKDVEIKKLRDERDNAEVRLAKKARRGKERKEEKELEDQIKVLKRKQSQLISEVKKLKEEKESIEGWKLIAKHHQDKKNELVKVCEDMADYVQTHATICQQEFMKWKKK